MRGRSHLLQYVGLCFLVTSPAVPDASLRLDSCPCLRCAVKICQTGCKEVCYSQAYSMDEMSASIFKEAGVVMRQIDLE